MPLIPTKQVEDSGVYSNFTGGPTLSDSLSSIDIALAGSSSPWIETAGKVRLVTTTNEVELPNGTEALPIISFTSDPTTGFYRKAAGEFAMTSSAKIIASFHGTDESLRVYTDGGTTSFNSWVAESSTSINFYGSSTTTTELLIGRLATASQTAHSVVTIRASGAILAGATNSNAVDLNFEVGQATGSGSDADMRFYTYNGGLGTGTAIRTTRLNLTLEGLTGYVKNHDVSSAGIFNVWNAESSTQINFYSSSGTTTELLLGRIATASQTAHALVTLKAAGAAVSGATDSDAVRLDVHVGQATGDGADADMRFFTYAGGGSPGTAIRANQLNLTLEGSTRNVINTGLVGTSHWSAYATTRTSGIFSGDGVGTTFLLGRVATATQTAHSLVVFGAAGAVVAGATDSDAVRLDVQVGQATGAGSGAGIRFFTYAGGLGTGTATRFTQLHLTLEGSTRDVIHNGIVGESHWNTYTVRASGFFSPDAVLTEFVIGRVATATQAEQTGTILRAGGALAGGATDADAVSLDIYVGQATGAGSGAGIRFFTYAGGGASSTLLKSGSEHTEMKSDGTFLIQSPGSAAIPTFRVGDSSTTGIYEPSVDAWAVSTLGTLALSIDTSQNVTIPNGNLSLTGTILAIGVAASSFTTLDGGILELAAVTTAPTQSPGTTNGGIFVDGEDLKYIQPDNTIVNLTGVWKRSGTVVSLANTSDFVHVDGTGGQLGIGVGTGPTGGAGGTNALVLKDKGAAFTAGVASAVSLFANGSNLCTIDASSAVACLLTNKSGAICETGSYTGNATAPQVINLVNTNLIPKLVLIYGDPGAASPVDGASANMGAKFGSSMSIVWKDNAGAPSILMETVAISAVTTGSFSVGGSLNLSSTGYHYMIIGTE